MDILHLCYLKDTGLSPSQEKCGGNSSAASSTAVGFEEIMLLHSEHVNFTSQLLYRFEFTCNVPGVIMQNMICLSPAANLAAGLCADLAKEISS
ncbi:unnamed protein product [Brassica napus]|uniref:(rape) hypothetical protein n=1 Tax=Brassica napus TaxID=3708 RepID=A0A816YGM1_BRANA|nr:unnamed protein product [Brassica napus]